MKKNVCVCVWCVCICMYIHTPHTKLNHFAVCQKLRQHCKSTILQLKKKKREEESKQTAFYSAIKTNC